MEKLKMPSNTAIIPSTLGVDSVEFKYNKTQNAWTITLGGKKAKITQDELHSLSFYAADSKQMEDEIFAKVYPVQPYTRQHQVEVQKDLKKGEKLVVSCTVEIPVLIEERFKREQELKVVIPSKPLMEEKLTK